MTSTFTDAVQFLGKIGIDQSPAGLHPSYWLSHHTVTGEPIILWLCSLVNTGAEAVEQGNLQVFYIESANAQWQGINSHATAALTAQILADILSGGPASKRHHPFESSLAIGKGVLSLRVPGLYDDWPVYDTDQPYDMPPDAPIGERRYGPRYAYHYAHFAAITQYRPWGPEPGDPANSLLFSGGEENVEYWIHIQDELGDWSRPLVAGVAFDMRDPDPETPLSARRRGWLGLGGVWQGYPEAPLDVSSAYVEPDEPTAIIRGKLRLEGQEVSAAAIDYEAPARWIKIDIDGHEVAVMAREILD